MAVKAASLSRSGEQEKEETTAATKQNIRRTLKRTKNIRQKNKVKRNDDDPKTVVWKQQRYEADNYSSNSKSKQGEEESFFHPFRECSQDQLQPKPHFLDESTTPSWLQIKYDDKFKPYLGLVKRWFNSASSIDDVRLDPTKDFTLLEGSNPTLILWEGLHSHSSPKSGTFPNPLEQKQFIHKHQVIMSAFDDVTVIKDKRGARGVVVQEPPPMPSSKNSFSDKNSNHSYGIEISSSLGKWQDGETVTTEHLIQHQHRIHHVWEFDGDHIVFFIDFYGIFAHIIIDMLPLIAYLRETYILPSNGRTKLLLPNSKNMLRSMIEQWDPQFASDHVSWIDCPRGSCENEMIRITGGGSLTVMYTRTVSLRHITLRHNLRKWIHEGTRQQNLQTSSKADRENSVPQKYVIYYTRYNSSARHGRKMDPLQEDEIVRRIEETMRKYKRPEIFVKFDGTISIKEQFHLFQHASVVIGPHGGGMANLMFLSSPTNCEDRPKVLEFLNNPTVPLVQPGGFSKTYYIIYETCPWVDYHHVLYQPPSDASITYINLDEFQLAMEDIFSSMNSSSLLLSTTKTV